MIPEWGDTFWMGSAMTARVCCSASATPRSTLIISGLVRVGEQAAMAGVVADVAALGMGTMVGPWLPVE
jgi:hypothetical protein